MNANTQLSIVAASVSSEQTLTDVHDRVTEAYYGKMGAQFMRETQQRIHWICGNVLGKKVLDVGCSQGVTAILLGREGKTVIAIDAAQRSINQAAKYLEQEPPGVRENVSFINGDFLAHDFGDEPFETIIIAEVLEHLLQPEAFIEAAAKRLVANGRLIVTVPFGINDFIDHKRTYYLLEPYRLMSCHFEVIEVMMLGKWLGLVGRRRAAGENIPSLEKLGGDLVERLEASFLALERGLREEATTVRTRLNDANLKYRAATEQIATFKQHIAKEELDRKHGDNAVAQLQLQLKQSEQSLRQVRAELVEVGTSAGNEHATHRETQARLEAERQALLDRIADMQEVHRSSTELMQAEREQLAQAKLARETAEQTISVLTVRLAVAEQASAHLTIQLAAAQQRSETERQARRTDVERLEASIEAQRESRHEAEKSLTRIEAERQAMENALKDVQERHRITRELVDTAREELVRAQAACEASNKSASRLSAQLALAEQSSAQLLSQLSTAEQRIEAEQQARHDEVARLEAALAVQCESRNEAETRLARLEAEHVAVTTFAEQSSAQLLSHLSTAEQRIEAVQQVRHEEIARLEAALAVQRESRYEAETRLVRFEAEYVAITVRLAEIDCKYRVSTERGAILKQRMQEAEASAWAQKQALDALHDKFAAADNARTQLLHEQKTADESKNNEISALARDIEELAAVRDALQHRVDESDVKLRAGTERLAVLDNELKAACARRDQGQRIASEQQATLTKQIEELAAVRDALQHRVDESDVKLRAGAERLAVLDNELKAACAGRDQGQRIATEQQAVLAKALQEERRAVDKLDINFKGMAAREQRYKERIAELEETARKVRHLDLRVRRTEREKISAEKRAEDAKKTLSFQLGYAIIQATQSWRGLMRLPSAIIQVRGDAKQRRDAKLLKSGRPLPIAKQETTKQVQAIIQMAEKFKVNMPAPQSHLRVAAVMDEFTFHSYNPECELLQLHPDTCVQQLTGFKPDLLFIESAWKGFEGLWQTKISNNGPEISACIEWCKVNKVPTMFWNKEDPVHFSTFIPLAQQVDYVFTTDIDCIPKYKHAIGHDRVFLLPFAAQPKTHNPIELFERKDAFNFAGSYYLRYPERQRDFAALIDTVKNFKTVDIYDRNFVNPHPHYTFPDSYKPMILGRLPFEEIDKAYKGYRYGINMNTIKQSQTMFARRVFELLASNTVVVSNFSRGVRLLFGDLVITSDEATQLHHRLQVICNNDIAYRKLRLMGLRKVMMEHTYAHRLTYIRAKLSGEVYQPQLPAVAVLAVARSAEEQALLVANFQRQAYPARTLYFLQAYDGGTPATAADIHTFTDALPCHKALDVVLHTTPLLAVFVAQDYYGPEYLTDLALASTYAPASAFGKVALYQMEGAGCHLQQDGQQYHPATSLLARAALVRSANIPSGWLDDCLAQPAMASLQLPDMLATDEFHYCCDGATLSAEVLCEALEDLPLANQGTSFAHTLAPTAESLQANAGPIGTDDGLPQLSAETLFKLISKPASKQLQLSFKSGTLQLQSTLPADKHGYIYANKRFTRKELNLVLNSQFRLDAESTIPDLRTIFEFQDADGQKISHAMNGGVGGKHALAIPNHCTTIRFGLRVQGPGKVTTQRLVLGNHGERPAAIAGQTQYLVLSKQYPAYEDLYRYGFLHSRVRGYKDHGLLVDVFRINNEPGQVYREFEGIDVASGDAQLLDDTLKTGRYRHVLVHMLDENMWRVLERHLAQIKVTVWVHGAEIQVWQRRAFEFVNMSPDEVARQKRLSDKRMKFWQKILKTPHPNLHLVFVSNYLKNEAIADSKIDLPDTVCSVVSNFIDGSTFPYREKCADDRLKLLSIRPYAKRVYANDLTVAAIVELSKRPFFKELSFTIVGDGELFEETVAPVRDFTNVSIEKRFLNHAEIAQYHQRHGVLIVPTRMDTQGVSRDEAMSSGLVPITTNVAAITEFVDDSCGIVVPAEDYKAIADAIEFLYRNPDAFLALSKAASKRVRQQCRFEQTIKKEIQLICQSIQ